MIGRPTPSLPVASPSRTLAAMIRASFSRGEQGAWFDPSDQGTLFQDSAGTTPVTAVEQPVGLMLDKRLGLVPGPELVVNGDGTNTAGWNTISATIQSVGDRFVVTNTTSFPGYVSRSFVTVIGRTYRMSGSFGNTSGPGSFKGLRKADTADATTGTNVTIASSGSGSNPAISFFSQVFTATASTTFLVMQVNGDATLGPNTATFDNLSCVELPGNHAFQTQAVNRPTFSARVNLLTSSESLVPAVWQKFDVIAITEARPRTIVPNTSVVLHYVIQSPTLVSGASYTFSCDAVADGYRRIVLRESQATGHYATFDLVSGTLVASSGGTGSIVQNPDGSYRCTLTYVSAVTGTCNMGLFVLADNGITVADTFAGNGVSGVQVNRIDIRPTNQAQLPYQRINTATDYDSAGFPKYLACNGTNQWMQTADVNLTGSDQVTVVAGVRKLSDAATAVVLEPGGFGNGAFSLLAPNTAAANLAFWSRGTISASAASGITFPSPITNALSGQASISGDSVSLRANGTLVVSNPADQGTGNYGNYPLFLFARSGSSIFFNGQFYGAIINARPTGIPTQTLTYFERYVNQNTRITLA